MPRKTLLATEDGGWRLIYQPVAMTPAIPIEAIGAPVGQPANLWNRAVELLGRD